MGVMIIPMVASLSEDAMSSVPNAMREGALALGATKLEVTWKVVIPAAISGIIASFVLGISRAMGETMIVTMQAEVKKFHFRYHPINADNDSLYCRSNRRRCTSWFNFIFQSIRSCDDAVCIHTDHEFSCAVCLP